ncbi:hypothetical protein CL656_06115 [bacterium]|nr:hypothetical protein [bacterium]|tara:strand:- start:721 stop:1377 length:657 start_codon:yes stop_codon:yes gene_type:complete
MKILIATPAYGGLVHAGYTESLLNTCMMLSSCGIGYEVKFIENQIVTRARNMLSSIFLKHTTFTHMLFLDADVVWNAYDVKKLIDHNLECVIGIYPNKQYYWSNGKLLLLPSSGIFKPQTKIKPNLIKIKYAATGFMLLKREALERIKHEVETFILPGSDGEKITLHNYFDCKVIGDEYLTEDYYFSYLFNKNGGEIYADETIKLKHIGPHKYGELCN